MLDLVKFYDYDVVLLRITQERLNDIDLIRRLRLARVKASVVVLTRSLSEMGRLKVLQAGADDLIVDPLSHEEVFMKVQNLVRRSRGFQDNALCIGDVEINMNAKKLYARGQPVPLTKKEYQIAEILALRKGVVLSKEAILDHLYGGLDEPNPKIIDVFICKIRKKMELLGVDDFVETNWGRGYMVIDHRSEARSNMSSEARSNMSSEARANLNSEARSNVSSGTNIGPALPAAYEGDAKIQAVA
ncbi:MAG: two-component system response regulator [Acidocella sp. 21-58-7]|nr:MAG: two-component system response regulator [Acidocella sp. 21-58-7]